MRSEFQIYDFPRQRIPDSKKDEQWAAECIDWIIAQAVALKDPYELELRYKVLNGEIPDEFYRKILNPYNATQEKYKRFPAVMRNYDLISGVIRRYLGEFIGSDHSFVVGANNPEVMVARNSKLRKEMQMMIEQELAAAINQAYQEYVQQGQDPSQFNPQQAVDVEKFIQDFNENFVDDISAQGQAVLNVIRDITDDELIYLRAYFDYVTFGECYTYTDVVGSKLIKRVVMPRDAFPVNSDSVFREDDDMFCERRKMTYQQIIDEFDENLNEKEKEFLDTYYAKKSIIPTELTFHTFESYFPDMCRKYSREDREFFRNNPVMMRDTNTDLYDVWHVVWRGESRKAIVTYVNELNMIDQRIEQDGYVLDPSTGDISMEYIYEPQVYEGIRIGTRNDAIYPYKARAVAYNRGSKLPYNGLNELLPGFGKFSIIDIMIPYQVFYNIVAYHREMVLAKNKLNILMIAKSLLGKVPEDTIYKMIADGVLYIDDSNDSGMLRAQNVRVLQSSVNDYIEQLSKLMTEIRESANEQVDMTAQRYGEIAASAGKTTTEEAVRRGSMGSVILEYMLDAMRERDYARDMDYSKFAWIDGLDTSYRDISGELQYISLDVDAHTYADYVVKAKNSFKEREKLNQIKSFAFNLGQNGDAMMAIAAIAGDNVASIKKLIKKFNDEKNQHEEQIQQMEQQTKQMENEFELQKIQAKGEQDRQTLSLKGYIEQEIELIKADANMVSFNADVGDRQQRAGIERLNDARARVEEEKVQVQREKNILESVSKEHDRKVKEKEIDTNLKIAQTNKNRYDVPASQRPKNKK